jgi:hypothetical protein
MRLILFCSNKIAAIEVKSGRLKRSGVSIQYCYVYGARCVGKTATKKHSNS